MQRMMVLGLVITALAMTACQGTPTGTGLPADPSFSTQDTSLAGLGLPAGLDTATLTQGALAGLGGAAQGLAGAQQGAAGAQQGLAGANAGLAGAQMGAQGAGMGMDLGSLGASMGVGLGSTGSASIMGPMSGTISGLAGMGGPTMGGLIPSMTGPMGLNDLSPYSGLMGL